MFGGESAFGGESVWGYVTDHLGLPPYLVEVARQSAWQHVTGNQALPNFPYCVWWVVCIGAHYRLVLSLYGSILHCSMQAGTAKLPFLHLVGNLSWGMLHASWDSQQGSMLQASWDCQTYLAAFDGWSV